MTVAAMNLADILAQATVRHRCGGHAMAEMQSATRTATLPGGRERFDSATA
jgi:hypothetical protein